LAIASSKRRPPFLKAANKKSVRIYRSELSNIELPWARSSLAAAQNNQSPQQIAQIATMTSAAR
jgi:hypothetical protein